MHSLHDYLLLIGTSVDWKTVVHGCRWERYDSCIAIVVDQNPHLLSAHVWPKLLVRAVWFVHGVTVDGYRHCVKVVRVFLSTAERYESTPNDFDWSDV